MGSIFEPKVPDTAALWRESGAASKMSSGRSDASTSTDDVKGRPLCLFYFTHPFGVLSPEPPTLAPAPPHLARAFLNMRPWGERSAPWTDQPGPWGHPAGPWGSPVGPWSSTDTSYSYATSTDRAAPVVPAQPVTRRDSFASSLISSDAWWTPAAVRRPGHYGKLLPPLRLPTSLDSSALDDSDELWPKKCMHPEKFSLPPIELPVTGVDTADGGVDTVRSRASRRGHAARRHRLGVSKPRHAPSRRSDLRRSIAGLMRRALAGARARAGHASPALRDALRTLRDAWPEHEPAATHSQSSNDDVARFQAPSSTSADVPAPAPAPAPAPGLALVMPQRAPLAPRASPGLLRRRYSVPETIMRKYRLAQQRSDSEEESAPPTERTCASSSSAAAVRHSAPLRRATACRACCCCSRSLDTSRAELRAPASPRRAADMLRAAMRNSYERAEESRLSDATYRSHAHRPRDPLSYDTGRADSPSRHSREPSADASLLDPIITTVVENDSQNIAILPSLDRRYEGEDTRSNSTISPPTAVEAGVLVGRAARASPPLVEIPPYEVLEIVVSETLSVDRASADAPPRRALAPRFACDRLDLDEYVSNILVESLNSLTDQLESMNASMGADRRVSVVEKEIKVKLQNAAVNTIVHLSPTSNNQIIFGNEELGGATSVECGEQRAVRDPRAVLRQIGRLFRSDTSDVDEYLLEREALEGPLGSVGTGNYFPALDDNPVVARFSAFPHTASMEVNTSSSEDPDPGGSECTSLVDSLDDPNSPRDPRFRPSPRALTHADVLALLPDGPPPREPEAFYVKIQGDACECVPEEASVAERMPDRIRQRLHRRHRKRELRMECLRRVRGRSARHAQARAAERSARALLDALVDDVIAQVARDEHRCARLQRRVSAERRRESSPPDERPRPVPAKNSVRFEAPPSERERRERHRVRGKLSLLTRSPPATDERAAKRIYQKSEIREGDNCIEILEILEYVNGSQSSPETAASDENHNIDSKTKKSRIPIPINEKNVKSPVNDTRKTEWRGSADRVDETRDAIAEMLARALGSPQRAPGSPPSRRAPSPSRPAPSPPRPAPSPSRTAAPVPEEIARRASVPHEARSRSNSLRFRRVFDMIPEERTGPGPENGLVDYNHNRRASAPDTTACEPPSGACEAELPAPPSARQHRATNTSPGSRPAGTSPPAPRAPRSERTLEDDGDGGDRTTRRGGGCSGLHGPNPPRPAPRRARRAPSPSPALDHNRTEKRTERTLRRERSEEETTSPIGRGAGRMGAGGADDSSRSSAESGGSLLCPLAPRWLAPRRRAPRAARAPAHADEGSNTGGWSVTVAGSCRAALPQDVEMRLRFPQERAAPCQDCSCAHCAACSCGARPPPQRAPPVARADSSKLTLTMKKEALDSSILASKSTRKASEPLPDVETYRASRSKLKSSVKTRRGYSLHCWLPDDDVAPIRASETGGLSVLGSAIVPELKPRARTMSERDLTRHCLRSLRC